MSRLSINASNFETSRTHIQRGKPLRKLNLNLRTLESGVMASRNRKISDLTTGQARQVATATGCNLHPQDSTQGCRNRLSEAEYEHLVELGHWHYRRQRRLTRRRLRQL